MTDPDYKIEEIFNPEHMRVHFRVYCMRTLDAIGSRWARADGAKGFVTVEGFNSYGSTDPWNEVVYSWEEKGVKKIWQKETFIFQTKYCLIVEEH